MCGVLNFNRQVRLYWLKWFALQLSLKKNATGNYVEITGGESQTTNSFVITLCSMTRLNKQGWTFLTRFHSSVLNLEIFQYKKQFYYFTVDRYPDDEYTLFKLVLRISFNSQNL